MHLQVPPQNTPLLWQLNSQKHISSIPELLRCCTVIVVTLNLLYVQVFKLRGKSHSLLDDPRTYAKTKAQISCVMTAHLISALVSKHIEQFLHFLNPEFQASSHLLWLHSPVYVGNPEERFSRDKV